MKTERTKALSEAYEALVALNAEAVKDDEMSRESGWLPTEWQMGYKGGIKAALSSVGSLLDRALEQEG